MVFGFWLDPLPDSFMIQFLWWKSPLDSVESTDDVAPHGLWFGGSRGEKRSWWWKEERRGKTRVATWVNIEERHQRNRMRAPTLRVIYIVNVVHYVIFEAGTTGVVRLTGPDIRWNYPPTSKAYYSQNRKDVSNMCEAVAVIQTPLTPVCLDHSSESREAMQSFQNGPFSKQ